MRLVGLPVALECPVSTFVLAGVGDPHGQVGHGLDSDQPTDVAALIEAYKPSVVIVEFTQRYLALTPAAGK